MLSNTKAFTYPHQLRIYQCIRILCRDEQLCSQVMAKKEPIEVLIFKLVRLAKTCIEGETEVL